MWQRFLNTLNRNTFLFVGGMAGVCHETILTHAERPSLLILFAAMMGLPAFLAPGIHMRTDEDKSSTTKPTVEDDNAQKSKGE